MEFLFTWMSVMDTQGHICQRDALSGSMGKHVVMVLCQRLLIENIAQSLCDIHKNCLCSISAV